MRNIAGVTSPTALSRSRSIVSVRYRLELSPRDAQSLENQRTQAVAVVRHFLGQRPLGGRPIVRDRAPDAGRNIHLGQIPAGRAALNVLEYL